MKKEKKEKFIDDGRTIFNMDIDGFKWHDKKKKESIYMRITKPYREAENYITQQNNYTHYEELEERYSLLCNKNS